MTLPNASAPYNSAYSAWTGLGDTPASSCHNGQLIQSGGKIYNYSDGSRMIYVWIENAPQGEYTSPPSAGIQGGDELYTENFNDSVYGAYSYVYDYRNGYSLSSSDVMGWDTSTYESGCSADYFVEGYIHDFGYHLAEFGRVDFSGSGWYASGTSGVVGSDNHDYYLMCNPQPWPIGTCGAFSNKNAHPGSISSDGTSFSVYFDNY